MRQFALFLAPQLAQPPFLGFSVLSSSSGFALTLDRLLGLIENSLRIAIELSQTVLVSQPLGRWRYAARGSDEPIPTPQIAFQRNEALPGLQRGLQTRAFRTLDNTNLAQPPRQLTRRLDMRSERFGFIRQRLIFRWSIEVPPMDSRLRCNRSFEIFAQRCAKGGLVTGRYANAIDRRRISILVGTRQQLGDCLTLGRKRVGRKTNTLRLIALGFCLSLRRLDGLFGRQRLGFDLADLVGEVLTAVNDAGKVLGVRRLRSQAFDLRIESRDLSRDLRNEVLALGKRCLEASELRAGIGGPVRNICEMRFCLDAVRL